MNRSFVITGGVTAFVAIFVVGLTHLTTELNEVPQGVNMSTVQTGAEGELVTIEETAVVNGSVSPQEKKVEIANQSAMSKKSTADRSYGVSSSIGKALTRQKKYKQKQFYSKQGEKLAVHNYGLETPGISIPSYNPPNASWDTGSGFSGMRSGGTYHSIFLKLSVPFRCR